MVADHGRSTLRRLRLHQRLAGRPKGMVSPPESFEVPKGQVEAAMRELRPAEREVLRLVVSEELTHAETASRLYCSPNAPRYPLPARPCPVPPDR